MSPLSFIDRFFVLCVALYLNICSSNLWLIFVGLAYAAVNPTTKSPIVSSTSGPTQSPIPPSTSGPEVYNVTFSLTNGTAGFECARVSGTFQLFINYKNKSGSVRLRSSLLPTQVLVYNIIIISLLQVDRVYDRISIYNNAYSIFVSGPDEHAVHRLERRPFGE